MDYAFADFDDVVPLVFPPEELRVRAEDIAADVGMSEVFEVSVGESELLRAQRQSAVCLPDEERFRYLDSSDILTLLSGDRVARYEVLSLERALDCGENGAVTPITYSETYRLAYSDSEEQSLRGKKIRAENRRIIVVAVKEIEEEQNLICTKAVPLLGESGRRELVRV